MGISGKEHFERVQGGYNRAKETGDKQAERLYKGEMNRTARRAQRFNAAGKDVIDEDGVVVAKAEPGKAAAYLRKQADYLDEKAKSQGKKTSSSFKVKSK